MMMERRWRTVEEGTFRIDIAALSTTTHNDQPRVQIDELNKTLGSHSFSFLSWLHRCSLCPYEIFICSVVIQAGSYQYFSIRTPWWGTPRYATAKSMPRRETEAGARSLAVERFWSQFLGPFSRSASIGALRRDPSRFSRILVPVSGTTMRVR